MGWPNWTSEKDYDFTENLSREGWAWEFLRRNEEYRASWERYLEQASECEKKFGKGWEKNQETWVYYPERKSGETPAQWGLRVTAEEPIFWDEPLKSGAAVRWHLSEMRDPDLSFEEHGRMVRFRKRSNFPAHLSDMIEAREYLKQDDDFAFLQEFDRQFAVVAFDLNATLDKQLGDAKASLAKRQKAWLKDNTPEWKNPKSKKWSDSLQLLDALRMKTKYADISNTLDIGNPPEDKLHETSDSPHIQAVKGRVKTARAQARNYLNALFSDKLPAEDGK